MSLLNMAKHPFGSGKVIKFPAPTRSPFMGGQDIEPIPEPVKQQNAGLLAAHSESSIMMGDSQISLAHTDDIVMGNGVNSLGENTVQILTEALMKANGGLNELLGREISDKLITDIGVVAAHELPPIMLNGFNQALEAFKIGGFLIDDFKEDLFKSLMREGVPGITQAHLKLINTNENYSRRFM